MVVREEEAEEEERAEGFQQKSLKPGGAGKRPAVMLKLCFVNFPPRASWVDVGPYVGKEGFR